MRFRELFTPKKFVSELGALRFGKGIFPEDPQKTPHYEMDKAVENFMNRPQINSGIRQLALFIVGKNIKIESKDPETFKFYNAWLEKRKDTKSKVVDFVISAIVSGNGFLEYAYRKMVNGDLILDNFFPLTDSSRIYRNLNAENEEEYWIYEVPTELKVYPFTNLQGELIQLKPKFWFINYVLASSTIYRRSVYGIPIHKDKIRHFKYGWSRDMIYGRSFLASTIDDVEVEKEIIKNWSIISRFRALNTKIISIGNEIDKASIEDINKLEEDLRQRKEHEHILINKPHTINTLANVGEYDDMSGPIEWLRKDVSSGLIPNYLTPWNSEVNRATAEEVRIVFELQLQAIRDDIVNFLNKEILGELRKRYPFLSEDATFVFETVDLEPKGEKLKYAGELFANNIITLNEYREVAGFEEIPEGDVYAKDLATKTKDLTFGDGQVPTPEQVSAQSFQEAMSLDTEDNDFKRKVNRKDFQVIKRSDIGRKILRMVKDEKQGDYRIFLSLNELKDFKLDEKKIADAYFEKQKDKLVKLQSEYLTGETPEDKITEKLFDEISELYVQLSDEFLKEMGNSKVKMEKIGAHPSTIETLDRVFAKFNMRIGQIINKVASEVEQGVEVNTDPAEAIKPLEDTDRADLKKSAELLQKNLEAQLKNFNTKKMQDVRRKLTDGIAAGKSHTDIKNDVKNDITAYKNKDNVYDFEIQRILRTEIGKSQNLLKLLKWKKQGFTHYVWRTMEDERVREEHKAKNQKVFKIDDALNGKGIFPGGSLDAEHSNINCRCTAVLWI